LLVISTDLYNIFVGKPHERVILKWVVPKLVASKLDTPGSEFGDWEACALTVKKLSWWLG